MDHVARCDGGCFFTSVAAEFDSRPGPVRDCIAGMLAEWTTTLERFVQEAVVAGHLKPGTPSAGLAFRLHGYELMLNLRRQLLSDEGAVRQARTAMRAAVLGFATAKGKRLLAKSWKVPA